MHLLNLATTFLLLTLVGAEFSVSAFVNPSAWRLDLRPQADFLSHFATVLGKVMPVWYAAGLILLGLETWVNRHAASVHLLLAASVLWLLATLGSILLLVPLNNHVIAAKAGWQQAHHAWDVRHRVRVAALAIASALFVKVMVR